MRRIDFCRDWFFYEKNGDKRVLDLPHDAMIEEERSPENKSGPAGAYFPGGKYTYEKVIKAPDSRRKMMLEFEGVYRNSRVFLNGEEIGGADYGYIPFFVDLTEHLLWGEDNILTVTVDNLDQPNSRWYTGSGIYRAVWLWESGEVFIEPRGIRITTLSHDPARIRVEVRHNGEAAQITVLDPDGKKAAEGDGSTAELDIPNAALWSDETPSLYTCTVKISGKSGEDEASIKFGIRSLTWGKDGLLINGKAVKLRGGCVHHDNGLLGARSYQKSEERKVRIMKKSGFNAIRSAHNPISPYLLEACDKLGMYIMDETWDVWQWHKTPFDYAHYFDKNWHSDISRMIERDYSHPSVIMYSIGNEISDPVQPEGLALERELVAHCKREDGTRPVTCGFNVMMLFMAKHGIGVYKKDEGGMNDAVASGTGQKNKPKEPKATGSLFFNMAASATGLSLGELCRLPGVRSAISPACDTLDIAGYNYGHARYKADSKRSPDRLIVGAETFRPRIAKDWELIEKTPNLIGDFQWAGWDYLGEAGCGSWSYVNDGGNFNKPYPWIVASSASIDLLGHPTSEGDIASAAWGKLDRPAIHVRPVKYSGMQTFKGTWRGTDALPSWSWCGCEGKKAKIEVYFKAHAIELLLNGVKIAKKRVKYSQAKFEIPYKPGTLEAIAYDSNGNEIARNQLVSAKGKLAIALCSEDESLSCGELCYITVDLVRDNGVIEANVDKRISVEVEGGELLGFGSANPKTAESYLSGEFTTYYGRVLAIVRAGSGESLTLTARAEGLDASSVSIPIEG